MTNPLIKVNDVSKVFKIWKKPSDMFMESITGRQRHTEFTALKNVSFDINPGQVVGILGRNGAGKSTLLRIIAQTLNATTGSVDVNGRIAAILELGTGFHGDYSGRENIMLGGMCLGMSKAEVEDKTDEIIDFAELRDFIDQPFRTYSTGMQARLTFAVATAIDPDVLIIDEALAVGDARFALKSFDRIRKFARDNKSILFVSHNIHQVMSFCDFALVLEKGEVVASGDPARIGNIYHKLLFGEDVAHIPENERSPKPPEPVEVEVEVEEQDENLATEAQQDIHEETETLDAIALMAEPSAKQDAEVNVSKTGLSEIAPSQSEENTELNNVETENEAPEVSNDKMQEALAQEVPPKPNKKIQSVVEELRDSLQAEGEREVRYGDGKVQITDFFILDGDGNKQTWLETLKPYEFVIEMTAYEDVRDLTMGIIVRTDQGFDVFGADSLQRRDPALTDLKANEKTYSRIQFQNNLAPGHYFATFSIARSDSHKHDLRFDVFEFIVAPVPGIYDAAMTNLEVKFSFDPATQLVATDT